eukprot:g22800.t1
MERPTVNRTERKRKRRRIEAPKPKRKAEGFERCEHETSLEEMPRRASYWRPPALTQHHDKSNSQPAPEMTPTEPACESQISRKATFTWPIIVAHGGVYTLCWKQESAPEGHESFVTFLSVLVVDGPQGGQAWRCKVAKECRISGLRGQGLQMGDLLRLLPLCSTNDLSVPFASGSEEGDFDWGLALAHYLPQTYRLCWCRPWNDTAFLNDSSVGVIPGCGPGNSLVDAGALSITGPSPGNEFTCFAGQTCMAIPLLGEALGDDDKLLIIQHHESCGQEPSVIIGMPSFGLSEPADTRGTRFFWRDAPLTASGADYRLCWCSPSLTSCNSSTDYDTDAGQLRLMGPRRDQEAAQVVGIESQGISQKLQPNASDFRWGSSLLSAAGGDYRICWCAGHELDGTPRACEVASDFVVDVGTLSINGPMGGQSWSCSTSRPCAIENLQGAGLTVNLGQDSSKRITDRQRLGHDRFLVKVGDCFGGATLRGLHWASDLTLVDSNGTTANVSWGNESVAAEGGEYRVCFCTEAGSEEPCNSQNPHRFTTDAGTLTIKGPRPAHAPWALQFGGEGNDTATHVLVDSAEPEKGLGHALVAGTTSGTIVNPKTTRGIAEASMTWTEGRSDSDYIATDCGWMRHDQGAEQYRATCRYLRLSLQPLNFSNFGSRDVWVTKVGYNGSLLWARQLGSAGDEASTWAEDDGLQEQSNEEWADWIDEVETEKDEEDAAQRRIWTTTPQLHAGASGDDEIYQAYQAMGKMR